MESAPKFFKHKFNPSFNIKPVVDVAKSTQLWMDALFPSELDFSKIEVTYDRSKTALPYNILYDNKNLKLKLKDKGLWSYKLNIDTVFANGKFTQESTGKYSLTCVTSSSMEDLLNTPYESLSEIDRNVFCLIALVYNIESVVLDHAENITGMRRACARIKPTTHGNLQMKTIPPVVTKDNKHTLKLDHIKNATNILNVKDAKTYKTKDELLEATNKAIDVFGVFGLYVITVNHAPFVRVKWHNLFFTERSSMGSNSDDQSLLADIVSENNDKLFTDLDE